MSKMLTATKYPTEIYSALTKTKTFSVTAEFTPADPYTEDEKKKKPDAPLKAYDSDFSRFVFTIIDKQGGNSAFKSGNINIPEVPALVNATAVARQLEALGTAPATQQIQSVLSGVEAGIDKVMKNLSFIYYHIRHGKPKPKQDGDSRQQEIDALIKAASEPLKILKTHKGQAPLQILKDDPSQRDYILKHKKFLEDNLEKFKGNQPQIDAIDAAVRLLDMGALQDAAAAPASAGGVIQIYKPSPRPLLRKKNEETGLCPVYEISIDWHIGDNSPVEVTIKTYDAPVKQNDSGMVMPEKSKAVNIGSHTFRMSDIQWSDCIYKMQMAMRRFEDSVAEEQLADARAIAMAARLGNGKDPLPERWFAEVAASYSNDQRGDTVDVDVTVRKYLTQYATDKKTGELIPILDRRKKDVSNIYTMSSTVWHDWISRFEASQDNYRKSTIALLEMFFTSQFPGHNMVGEELYRRIGENNDLIGESLFLRYLLMYVYNEMQISGAIQESSKDYKNELEKAKNALSEYMMNQ